MNDASRDWKTLPNELLEIIIQFASIQQSKIHSCNVALVCKAWKDTAQAIAYSNIAIKTIAQFEKFHNVIIRSPHLGIKIRNLNLGFITYQVQETDIAKVSTILTTLLTTSLPNLEVLENYDLHTYIPTLHTLLDSHLRKLKRLTHPRRSREGNEVTDYATCVFLMKDRIESIYISRSSRTEEKIEIQYQRLYDSLYQFSNLVFIQLEIETDDGVPSLEYVVEACRSLKDIQLRVRTPRRNNQPIHLQPNEISKYIPRPNIKSLNIRMFHPNNYNLLLYTMHKFPHLQNFCLFISNSNPGPSITLVSQLLEYVSAIDSYSVYDVLTNENSLMEIIGKIWQKTSEPGSEKLYIDFDCSQDETSVEFTKEAGERGRNTKLMYPANEDFDWRSYMDFLEKYGKYIGTLRFRITLDDNSLGRFELSESFFPHTLTYSPNLIHFQLCGCALKRFDYSDVNLNKKFFINELRFFKCEIEPGALEQLSVLLDKVNQLNLYDNKNYSPQNVLRDEDKVNVTIKMPYTNVNTLFLADDSCEVIHVKVFAITDKEFYYYRTDIAEDTCIKPSTEQEYTAENNEQHVYINCLNNPRIQHKFVWLF